MRKNHYLFPDPTTDKHLTSSGIASDYPYGRGIWLSNDTTKKIYVGE
jgi:creatine kinase